MPVFVFNNVAPAQKILSTKVWTRVHFQQIDGNTLYISRDRNTLEVAGAGLQQGIAITKSMGIVTLAWIGDMYGIGSAPQTTTNIEPLVPPGAGAGP